MLSVNTNVPDTKATPSTIATAVSVSRNLCSRTLLRAILNIVSRPLT